MLQPRLLLFFDFALLPDFGHCGVAPSRPRRLRRRLFGNEPSYQLLFAGRQTGSVPPSLVRLRSQADRCFRPVLRLFACYRARWALEK
jgi:hypothetical protein